MSQQPPGRLKCKVQLSWGVPEACSPNGRGGVAAGSFVFRPLDVRPHAEEILHRVHVDVELAGTETGQGRPPTASDDPTPWAVRAAEQMDNRARRPLVGPVNVREEQVVVGHSVD